MTETAPLRSAPRLLPAAAILFDLDGTLADTAGDLVGALNRVRAERGLAPLSTAALRAHASSGARGLIGAGMGIGPDDDRYRALRDAFLAYYEAGLADTTRLFDGIDALLKAERFTWPVLTALGLAKRASVVVCGDTTTHAKPHPAPLLYAADSLSIAVDRCVYVGDDLRDVQAGNAAGMPTIVAAYGYLGETGDCTGWPATGWIASPGELLSWLA